MMWGKTKILDEPWELYAGDENTLRIVLAGKGFYQQGFASRGTIWKATWRPSLDSDEAVELEVEESYSDGGLIVTVPAELTATGTGAINRDGVFDVQGIDSDAWIGGTGKIVFTVVAGRTAYIPDVTR